MGSLITVGFLIAVLMDWSLHHALKTRSQTIPALGARA